MRLRILVGIAVALGVATIVRLVFLGADGVTPESDPNLARIERLQRQRDVAALAREVSHPSEPVARRAVDALGALGPAGLEPIAEALADRRTRVRERAATAFARVATYEEAAPLAKLAREDASPDVRAAAVSGLGHMRAFREVETLITAMSDADVAVRRRAAAAVASITGISVGFKATDPRDRREPAVERMRAVWAEQKQRVSRYWTVILTMRKQRAEGG